MLKPNGKKIIEYNKEFEYVTDIIGKAVAAFPFTPSTPPSGGGSGSGGGGGTTINFSSLTGMEPLKRLITLWESSGGDMSRYNSPSCYNAYKGSTGWVAAFGSDISTFTIKQVIDKSTAAVGKYQFIDSTLESIANSLGLNLNTTKFTPAIQEKCGEKLIMNQVKNYITGVNAGNLDDLENAVLSLARTWAALPTALKAADPAYYATTGRIKLIPNSDNNVELGIGSRTCFGGISSNKYQSRFLVTESVKALVKTRQNLTGNNTFYRPLYATII